MVQDASIIVHDVIIMVQVDSVMIHDVTVISGRGGDGGKVTLPWPDPCINREPTPAICALPMGTSHR